MLNTNFTIIQLSSWTSILVSSSSIFGDCFIIEPYFGLLSSISSSSIKSTSPSFPDLSGAAAGGGLATGPAGARGEAAGAGAGAGAGDPQGLGSGLGGAGAGSQAGAA